MAMDVCVLDDTGKEVDMGTPFDYLSEDPEENPAARDYRELPQDILEHRERLETAFMTAAKQLQLTLLPLPSEWWDFRFPKAFSETFLPLKDTELPSQIQMCAQMKTNIPDFLPEHFDTLTKGILEKIENLQEG